MYQSSCVPWKVADQQCTAHSGSPHGDQPSTSYVMLVWGKRTHCSCFSYHKEWKLGYMCMFVLWHFSEPFTTEFLGITRLVISIECYADACWVHELWRIYSARTLSAWVVVYAHWVHELWCTHIECMSCGVHTLSAWVVVYACWVHELWCMVRRL